MPRNTNFALDFAVLGGESDRLRDLVRGGVILDDPSRDRGFPPLLRACENERGEDEIVLTLLELGAKIDAKGHDRWTPLHGAASTGKLAIIQALLDRGADLEAEAAHKRTPLATAAEWGQAAVVQLLLARGASVDGTIGKRILAADPKPRIRSLVEKAMVGTRPSPPPIPKLVKGRRSKTPGGKVDSD